MAITINIHAETVEHLHRDLRQLLQGVTGTPVLITTAPQLETVAPSVGSVLSAETDKPKVTRTKVQPAAQTTTVADDMAARVAAGVLAENTKAIAEREAREAAEAEINAKIAAQHEAEVEAAAKAKAAHTDVDDTITRPLNDAERQAIVATLADKAAEQPKVIDYEADIKPRVIKLAESKGRAGVLAVFDTFGVDHASKVPVESYGKLVAALDNALKA